MLQYLFFYFSLFGATAFAVPSPPVTWGPNNTVQALTTRGMLVGNRLQEDDNFIINPSAFVYPIAPFTNSTNNGVTASVSATVSRSTTTPLSLSNVAEFNITFGAINQSVSWLTKPLSSGLKGRQCEANWTYRGFQSSTRFQIRFNGVTRYQVAATVSATDAVPGSIPFPCGDLTETITFVVADTGFLSGTNEISDVEIGAVKAFGDAANIGGWVDGSNLFTPTNFGTVSNPSYKYRRVGDSMDVRATFQTGARAGSVASLVLPFAIDVSPAKMISGVYNVVGNFWTGQSGSPFYTTATNGAIGAVIVDSADATRVFFSSEAAATNGITKSNATNIGSDSTYLSLKFTVPISQWSSSNAAVSPGSQNFLISATASSSTTPSLGVVNVSSLTEITDANTSLQPAPFSDPVATLCSGTNAPPALSNSATTCPVGSESMGITFNVPTAGNYEVCAQFNHYIEGTGTPTLDAGFYLFETGLNNQSFATSGSSATQAISRVGNTPTNVWNNISKCEIFSFSSAGQKAVRMAYRQSVGGGVIASLLGLNTDGVTGPRALIWTVKRAQSAPTPIFIQSPVRAAGTGVAPLAGDVGFDDPVVTSGTIAATTTNVAYNITSKALSSGCYDVSASTTWQTGTVSGTTYQSVGLSTVSATQPAVQFSQIREVTAGTPTGDFTFRPIDQTFCSTTSFTVYLVGTYSFSSQSGTGFKNSIIRTKLAMQR